MYSPENNEPCSEASVKYCLEFTEKLYFLFNFDCSTGLVVLISTIPEKEPCSQAPMKTVGLQLAEKLNFGSGGYFPSEMKFRSSSLKLKHQKAYVEVRGG